MVLPTYTHAWRNETIFNVMTGSQRVDCDEN
jgi:hypothetical protein